MSAPARAPRSGGRAAPASARPEPLVAVLEKRGRLLVAEPLFERGGRIAIDSRGRGGAGPGDMVLLGRGKRGVRVARVLGRPTVAREVVEAHMLERGLRRLFPRAVEDVAQEAAVAPVDSGQLTVDNGNGVGSAARLDLTALPTFTIDPVSARDYDDAISAERLGDGRVRVWVHIADVGAYVRPGSALDGEAFRRGTSVYVPGAVEPMLPEVLSNGACSLVPGEERPAVSVEMLMDGAELRESRFHRSTIRSDARLSYDAVDRVFAGSEPAAEPWGGPLEVARGVAAALSERRSRRGALAVSSPGEPQFEFDSEGQVDGIRWEQQTEAHGLIEQLMILANEAVAGYLADRRLPTLYRVHERPDPQAIVQLVEKLASLDVPTPALPEHLSPQQAADLVGEVSRLAAAHVERTGRGRAAITSLVLRSLKQAYYTPKNLGHTGLASLRYCHFTSPIRRYPDLVAHRALLAGIGTDDVAPRASDLYDVGVACSAAERDAMRIERDADDICRAFLLERVLAARGGEEPARFEGEVVGLIGAGAFVRFGHEGFEGMLPVRRLRGDWWNLNEEGTALVAERSGRRLCLGDPVEVVVGRVEAPRGRVDLYPADAGD